MFVYNINHRKCSKTFGRHCIHLLSVRACNDASYQVFVSNWFKLGTSRRVCISVTVFIIRSELCFAEQPWPLLPFLSGPVSFNQLRPTSFHDIATQSGLWYSSDSFTYTKPPFFSIVENLIPGRYCRDLSELPSSPETADRVIQKNSQ